MLDVPMIDSLGDMIDLAMMATNIPPKALALEIGYSVDSLYSAIKGERSIPVKARAKLASKNLIMACAVAMESTGLSQIFGYQKVDRHIQSMILRVKNKDKEIGVLLDDLPLILLDKERLEDLSDADLEKVKIVAEKLGERMNYSLNLMMELDSRYRLDITEDIQKQKKSPVLAHRRLSENQI
jgi:hypothetical protein